MSDALSSRLLEAIQKTEKAAHLTDADLIPRLCQAHREIVETYRRLHDAYVQRWAVSTAPPLEPIDHFASRMSYMSVVRVLAHAYCIEATDG